MILALLMALGLPAAEPGFAPLFDGKTLHGWTLVNGTGRGYVVEDGVLVCPVDGGGNLLTEREYANFVLRLEFKLSEGGNNGVGLRAPLDGRTSRHGMEIQILDDSAEKFRGKLKPAQHCGSIYDVFPAGPGHLKPVGEWNEYEITANGRQVSVKLNGAVVVDADLDRVEDPDVLKLHPGLKGCVRNSV